MKLNVFGRQIEVVRDNHRWNAYYVGNEGKRRLAEDIVIAENIEPEELPEYLADLCHEWATADRGSVTIID